MIKEFKVAVICGCKQDIPVAEKGLQLLKEFGIEYELVVCSSHENWNEAADFAKAAEIKGFGVIVATADSTAKLPMELVKLTKLPVICLPVKASLGGLDSYLHIGQVLSGIPVVTVAVDGGENAAILAVQMLAAVNDELRHRVGEYKANLEKMVIEKNEFLQQKLKGV